MKALSQNYIYWENIFCETLYFFRDLRWPLAADTQRQKQVTDEDIYVTVYSCSNSVFLFCCWFLFCALPFYSANIYWVPTFLLGTEHSAFWRNRNSAHTIHSKKKILNFFHLMLYCTSSWVIFKGFYCLKVDQMQQVFTLSIGKEHFTLNELETIGINNIANYFSRCFATVIFFLIFQFYKCYFPMSLNILA